MHWPQKNLAAAVNLPALLLKRISAARFQNASAGAKECRGVASAGAAATVTQADATPAPRSMASGISSERASEIQEALIKQGYLEGPASGQYDEKTSEAMKQFQAANKLPTTGLPSAHTLKRLGVSKRSNDGYAVPVKSVSVGEKKP